MKTWLYRGYRGKTEQTDSSSSITFGGKSGTDPVQLETINETMDAVFR